MIICKYLIDYKKLQCYYSLLQKLRSRDLQISEFEDGGVSFSSFSYHINEITNEPTSIFNNVPLQEFR